MRINLRFLSLSLVPALLMACAADATPEGATSASEETGAASEAMCGNPLVPAATGTMNPDCSVKSIVTYTTSSGYTTANCTGRAGITAYTPPPACLNTTSHWPSTEWSVQAVGSEIANLGGADCSASYIDYSLTGLAKDGTWHTVNSHRVYGFPEVGGCSLRTSSYPASTGLNGGLWVEAELTAAAYRHLSLPFGASLTSPVDVTLTIRQGYFVN